MSKVDKEIVRIINQRAPGTIVIFDRVDFYACYAADASQVANEIFKSDVCLKNIVLEEQVMCYLTMNSAQFQRVVRELLTILRYRVELYVQDDDDNWVIKAKGTVGNMGDFDDIIGDETGVTVMAITFSPGEKNNNYCSVAFWNTNEFRITCSEIDDTPLFSNVEQCIVGLMPRECVVLGSCEHSKALSNLLKRLHIVESSAVEMPDGWDEAKKIFVEGTDLDRISENVRAIIATMYDYLKIAEQTSFIGKFSLCNYGTQGYMHIDAAAVSALELFGMNRFSDSENDNTLFHIMNKCRTAGGARLLREWISRPLSDIRQIVERQDAITALMEAEIPRSNLRDRLLPRIPDGAQLSRRLFQKNAKLQECYRVYQMVMILPEIEKAIRLVKDVDATLAPAVKDLMLEPVCFAQANFEGFMCLIQQTVDENYFNEVGVFRVKPEIEPELLEVDNNMKEIQEKAEKAKSKVARKLELPSGSIRLDTTPQGFQYRVTLKDEKAIRKTDGITIISTNKGNGVSFRDRELEDLSKEYNELQKLYETAQAKLEESVVANSIEYATIAMPLLISALSTIDVLTALAELADSAPTKYVRPVLAEMGTGIFDIRRCRHPILELVMQQQFIPNDVQFGDDRLIILTGANMGGKSTYLRSVALCVLMAQMGSYIPAESAHISVVDAIFTRIGASDQQTRGVSTFMAEMLDCSSILQTATANSLVVMDELGRGTSTFDGFGLAWGIATELLEEIRCFTLFATHFHEMAGLAEKEGVATKQMSVSLENGELTMLYEVKPGVAQSSFGIHVAQMVGFDPKIIQDANEHLKRLESNDKNTIKRLKEASDDELRQLILSL